VGTSAPNASAAPATPVGYAKAASYTARLAPSIGGTALTFTLGGAGSYVQNKLANGIAATIDLGLVGTIFENGACGYKAPFNQFVPPATLVTNEKGDKSAHAEIAGAGGVVGAGAQDVVTTTQPLSDATIHLSEIGFAKALSVGGMVADAKTQNVDGSTPLAEAVAQSDLELPGVLSLRHTRWESRQQGGSKPGGTGAFSFSGGTVLGVRIPGGDASTAEKTINTLTEPLGLTVTMPRVEKEMSGSTAITRVTPLVLSYAASETTTSVLRPLFDVTRQFKQQLVEAIASSCFSSYGALLADLLLGFAVGSGRMTLLVGGVETSTNDDTFVDPFGAPTAPLESLKSGPTPAAAVAPSRVVAGVPGAPGVPGHAGTASEVPAPVANVSFTDKICETVHPKGSPGCSNGAGLLAGALVLVAALGAAAYDFTKRRRARVKAPA